MSLITSIIGGVQGASAAHNAGSTAAGGQTAAGTTVSTAGTKAGNTVAGATTTGLGSIGTAQNGVTAATTGAQTGATASGTVAAAGVDPYAATGAQAATKLGSLMAPGGSLATPQTASQIMQNDPGYQFQLQQGEQAIQRANAAAGLTGSGGEGEAEAQYAEGAVQSGYQQAFNDTMTQQQNQYNDLSGLAQQGQAAAQYQGNVVTNAAQYAGNAGLQGATTLGQLGVAGAQIGLSGADTQAQIDMQTGAGVAGTQIAGANDIANGDINAANAWNGMLNGISNSVNAPLTVGLGTLGSIGIS